MSLDEFTFEIVAALTQAGGYAEGAVSHFDADRGIDTAELAAFIGATQADEWSELVALHGGAPMWPSGRSTTGSRRNWMRAAPCTCCAVA